MPFHVPEKYRIRSGSLGSDSSYGNNWAFLIPQSACGKHKPVFVIARDGAGWEHASVSRCDGRMPTWADMCRIKEIFWDEEDCVMQLHAPRSEYVNNHPGCLHLWRPIGADVPRPPGWMVGIRDREAIR